MHGNTYAYNNIKTRRVDDIFREIHLFFEIHHAEGTVPGGVHLEMTGENVTECVGGHEPVEEAHLHRNYLTACDPRLNARQGLELSFQLAEMLTSVGSTTTVSESG